METNLSDDVVRLCENPITGDKIVFDDGMGEYPRTLEVLDDGYVRYAEQDTAVFDIDGFCRHIGERADNVVRVVFADRGED